MYKFTVLFADNTKATIKADDIDEAYFMASRRFTKTITDIWCD